MQARELSVQEILSNLVKVNSVSGNEGNIGDFLGNFLKGCGFSVEFQEVAPGRKNVFARKGNPTLLFFGHMDTVPVIGNWEHEPFRLTVEGDRGYGLGAWDMKGGLAAILHAAQSATDMAALFTVDEEEISRGAFFALRKKEFFAGIRGMVSAEAGNEPGTFGGARHISYGRNGRVAFEITRALGAGHAATAESGWAGWIYRKVGGLPKMKSRIVVRRFEASSSGLSMPDSAKIEVDVLVHPSEKGMDFQKVLSEHFEGEAALRKRETPYLEPYSFEKNPFVEKIAECVRREIGEPSFHIGTSVGDENALAQLGIPIAIVGPEGRNEHGADEWVSLKSVGEVARLYSELLEKKLF